MKLYMQITKDKYELPIAVATSAAELARMTGAKENNIASQCSRRARYGELTGYVKVEVEDDDVFEI